MKIEYLSHLLVRYCVNPDHGRRWQLQQPFPFTVDGEHFEAPAAFWTDFASIPRLIWPIVSPYDLGHGPVPHDFGYYSGLKDKVFWDRVFLACMEKDEIDIWKRRPAYRAVGLLGWPVWNKYREQGETSMQLARLSDRSKDAVV